MLSTRVFFTLLSLSVLLIMSCQRKETRLTDELIAPYDSTSKQTTLKLSVTDKKDTISSNVKYIVEEISDYNRYDGPFIGIAAMKSPQYARFEKLKNSATLYDLLKLTNHPNNVVKAYAFKALLDVDSKECITVLNKHLLDTGRFHSQSGCLGYPLRLNAFFLEELNPENTSEKKYAILDKKTFAAYCKKLNYKPNTLHQF